MPPMRRTWSLGRLLVTTTRQAQSPPLVDRCWGYSDDEPRRRYRGWAIYLAFWRRREKRNAFGLALVIGWWA